MTYGSLHLLLVVSITQASGRFAVSFRHAPSATLEGRAVASGKGDNIKVIPPSTVMLQPHHVAHRSSTFFRLAQTGTER